MWKVFREFYKKEEPPKVLLRKDVKRLTEHVFTIKDNGETYKFFKFKELVDTPSDRDWET